MKKIKLFTLLVLMSGLAACQKEDQNDENQNQGNNPSSTKQEILASQIWVLTAMTVDPAMMGKTDLYRV